MTYFQNQKKKKKMFFSKLVILLLTSLTVCLTVPIETNFSANPQRCCLPNQFTSTLVTSVGTVVGKNAAYVTHVSQFFY